MSTPLIGPEQDFALWALMFGVVALSLWVERTPLGQRISAVFLTILGGMVLSNFGLAPFSAPAYDTVYSTLVPVAIVLLLLRADLRSIVRESGLTLAAFAIGALGTSLGATLGVLALDLGPRGADVAGALAASWIGGSLNFAATSSALELQQDPSLMASALAADAVAGTLFLAVLLMVPTTRWITRWFPTETLEPDTTTGGSDDGPSSDEKAAPRLVTLHIALLLGLAAAICAIGNGLAAVFGVPSYGILFITAIAVAVANLFSRQLSPLRGDFELGMLLMYVFFTVIGLGADVPGMIRNGPLIFGFAIIMASTHLVVVLGLGRLFRLDLPELIIGSNACALGPPTAAAMAASRGWNRLVTPGIMCGIFGYATATFVGVALARWLGG